MTDQGAPAAIHVSKHIKQRKLDAWTELVGAVLEEGERAHAIFPVVSVSYSLLAITNLRLFGLNYAERKKPTKAIKKAVRLEDIAAVRAKEGRAHMYASVEVEVVSGGSERYASLQLSDVEDILLWIKSATGEVNHSPIVSSEIAAKAEAHAERAALQEEASAKREVEKNAVRAEAEADKEKRRTEAEAEKETRKATKIAEKEQRAEASRREREERLHEKMVAMGLLRKPDGTFQERPEPAEAGTPSSLWTEIKHGTRNSALVCPHCQTKGQVHTHKVEHRTGTTGLLGTIFTGGLTLILPSPKDTEAWCGNCKTEWRITK